MFAYITALAISLTLLTLHLIGIDSGIYYNMPRYDIVTHSIGGLAIGFFVFALLRSFFPNLRTIHLSVVLCTILLVSIWEVFEFYFRLTDLDSGITAYLTDTSKDLLIGIVGAYAASAIALYATKRLNRPSNEH